MSNVTINQRTLRLADGAIWRWENQTTYQTTAIQAPVHFFDDFIGGAGVLPGTMGSIWEHLEEGTPTSLAVDPNSTTGGVLAALAATNEAEEHAITFGDILPFKVSDTSYTQIEFRAKVASASYTNVITVMGLASAYTTTKTGLTRCAVFGLSGSDGTKLNARTDDNTTDTNGSNILTIVNDVWHIYRIDLSNINDIKFYVDGVKVSTANQFAMATLTTPAYFQPFFSVQKASGTAAPTLYLDYVRVWSAERT